MRVAGRQAKHVRLSRRCCAERTDVCLGLAFDGCLPMTDAAGLPGCLRVRQSSVPPMTTARVLPALPARSQSQAANWADFRGHPQLRRRRAAGQAYSDQGQVLPLVPAYPDCKAAFGPPAPWRVRTCPLASRRKSSPTPRAADSARCPGPRPRLRREEPATRSGAPAARSVCRARRSSPKSSLKRSIWCIRSCRIVTTPIFPFDSCRHGRDRPRRHTTGRDQVEGREHAVDAPIRLP